jgi:hypothetical protein
MSSVSFCLKKREGTGVQAGRGSAVEWVSGGAAAEEGCRRQWRKQLQQAAGWLAGWKAAIILL